MAQFQEILWKLSKEEEQTVEFRHLSEGQHDLYVQSATWDDERMIYGLTLHSLTTDEQGAMSFFLKKKDGTKNQAQYNTIISLGHALAGKPIGVPFFESIIGGVVHAEVKLTDPKINAQGKEVRYAQIFHFEPVSMAAIQLAVSLGWNTIDQYVKEDQDAVSQS